MLKESKADIFVDPVLHTACALDLKHHCAAITPGRGRRRCSTPPTGSTPSAWGVGCCESSAEDVFSFIPCRDVLPDGDLAGQESSPAA